MDNAEDKILALLQQPHLSDEDIEWIVNYAGTPGGNQELRELLQARYISRLQQENTGHYSERAREMLNVLHGKMEMAETAQSPLPTIRLWKRGWIRYAAAVILIAGIGAYLWNIQRKERPSVTQNNPVPVQNDVAPGGNRATLTLADGSTINLDSAAKGELAREDNTTITKTEDGKIIYDANEKPGTKVLYNTLATPRGGQYQLNLPDGSLVWLNAESSITYPTVFAGNERKVSITGEAYFEVAKNKSKKFIVEVAGDGRRERADATADEKYGFEIEVLGTHFNVNAYSEETSINTTLLEGSVRITSHVSRLPSAVSRLPSAVSRLLKPGQQAVTSIEEINVLSNIDIDQVIAWKNGVFNFNNTNVEVAMRQLSRWYDVNIQFDGKIPPGEFGGEIGRNLNLSQVLKILDGVVARLSLEGRTLHVSAL